MTMCHFNSTLAGMTNDQTDSFLQTYNLKKELSQFGDHDKTAAHKEFEPIQLEEMTQLERKRALESQIFLVKSKMEKS